MGFETKTYTSAMQSLRNRIMFRLDYYSLPQFKEKYFKTFGEITNNYKETNLSEIERQMIDVDSAAYNLTETLDTILAKSVYYFTDVPFDEKKGIIGDIVVGPYYLFLQLFLNPDGEITPKCIERIQKFLFVKDLINYTTTKKFTCQVDYQKSCIANEVESFVDINAYTYLGTTTDTRTINSRYSDEYFIDDSDRIITEPIDISLIRMLQLGIGDDEQYYYNVLINTNLCITLDDDFSKLDKRTIDRIIRISEVESSRCFK